MKKTVTYLLVMILCVGVIFSGEFGSKTVQASTIQNTDEKVTDMTVTNLTREEYIQKLSEIEKISLDEARARLDKREVNEGMSTKITPRYYQQLSATKVVVDSFGAKCELQYGCLATVENMGSFRWYSSAEGAYVNPSGSGYFTWKDGYAIAKVSDDANSISVLADGVIEGTIDKSYQWGFEYAGFSVSASTGTTYYVRKAEKVNGSFSLY